MITRCRRDRVCTGVLARAVASIRNNNANNSVCEDTTTRTRAKSKTFCLRAEQRRRFLLEKKKQSQYACTCYLTGTFDRCGFRVGPRQLPRRPAKRDRKIGRSGKISCRTLKRFVTAFRVVVSDGGSYIYTCTSARAALPTYPKIN